MASKEFGDADVAREIAGSVFDHSTECLMAHSIRAVERYLGSFKYRVHVSLNVLGTEKMRSLFPRDKEGLDYLQSGCSVPRVLVRNPSKFQRAIIWVNGDGGHNNTRLRIAHELYHVVWSVMGIGETKTKRSREAEEVCDIFARTLCKKHDQFYEKPENIGKLRFWDSIDSFRSV